MLLSFFFEEEYFQGKSFICASILPVKNNLACVSH